MFSFLTLMLCSQATAAHITLTLFDDYNRSCREAEVGSHYRLEARIQETSIKGWPQVAGLPADAVVGRQQRQEVSWLQGKKTESTCFVWEVMFKTPGTITLGPISYTDHTSRVISPSSLSIVVHEPSATHTTSSGKTTSAASTFIRWEIDRLEPFAGEVVPVRLVFYTTDATVQLENISEIDPKDAHLELTREPTWANTMHNGISYKTATWEGILITHNSGMLSMPPVTLSYRVSSPHENSYSPWAMMHRMLSSFSRLHQKRSATLSLHIKALPPTKHTIVGVGEISSATRTCNNVSLRCGEAGTMTYHLEGSIHPNYLRLPAPVTSDQSAKIYNSTYTHRGSYPSYHYEQEYVVHAQEAGHTSCEEQALWYFNPKKESYESCTITACEIEVLPSEKAAPLSNKAPDVSTENNEDKEKLAHVMSTSTTPKFPIKPMLPLRLFVLLLLMPCLIAVSKRWVYEQYKKLYYTIKLGWIRRAASRKLANAIQHKNGYMILHIMQHVARNVHDIPRNESEGNFVEQYLITRGAEYEKIQNWKKLWQDLQEAAFSSSLNTSDYESLHCRCNEWINTL